MGALNSQALGNGLVAVSTDTDNGTATASVAAQGGVTNIITGYAVDYSAAPAAGYKTIQVIANGVTYTFRHDLSTGGLMVALPGVIRGAIGGAVSATLGASGTGGVTGRITLFYFTA